MEAEAQSDYLNYLAILRRRWLPAGLTFATVLGLTIAYVLIKAPIYRIQGQVLFQKDNKSSALIGLSALKDLAPGLNDADRAIETELRVIQSQPLIQRTLDLLRSRYPQEEFPEYEDFLEDLTVKTLANTNVIQLSYDDTNRQRAVLIVNQLMDVYLESDLKTTRSTSVSVRQFILTQLPEVRRTVFRADVALRQFKERYKLTDLEVATKSNAENLSRLDAQIGQAQAQLTSLNSDFQNLQRKLNLSAQEALALSSVSQSSAVQASLAEVEGLERQLAAARAQVQEDHPLVINLRAKVNEARGLLQVKTQEALPGQVATTVNRLQVGPTQQELLNTLIKTEISRTSLGNQLSTLNRQRSDYLQQATFLPGLVQRERELNRELLAAESTYQSLLKSLQDASVSENQTIGNVRVIEPAQIPEVPIAPNKRAAIAAGTLAGLLLAIALLYLLETMDKRIRQVEEAREIFGFPLLGTIPQHSEFLSGIEFARVPVLHNPKSSLSESYRILQANIKFLHSDNPTKVIAVTSSIPQEGKSTTTANLAAALNQMGHRVLVVDCDLRRPSQHQFWDLANTKGISDYLAGQVSHNSSVVNIVMPGLEVITSGTLPPNPLALLDSHRMGECMRSWAKDYDYVLLDTPPVSAAADAAVLGRLADGLLIVARPEVLDKNSANITKDYLGQAGLNILGLVVNGMNPKNEAGSYYYYSQYTYYAQEPSLKNETIKSADPESAAAKNGFENNPPLTGIGAESKKQHEQQ